MEPRRISKAAVVLISLLFVAYGIYALVQSRANPQWISLTIAGLSVLGGIGLWIGRPWSRFCIYIVSLAVVSAWAYYTALAAPKWRHGTLTETVIAFLPGAFLLVIVAGSSYLVARHFSTVKSKF